jgi:hypothetical protein
LPLDFYKDIFIGLSAKETAQTLYPPLFITAKPFTMDFNGAGGGS